VICPSCEVGVRLDVDDASEAYPQQDPAIKNYGFDVAHGFCPECGALIVLLRHGRYSIEESGERNLVEVLEEQIIHPQHKGKRRVAPEVPVNYRQDFQEANAVLPVSPKASAAISRRLLQHVLHEDFKINHGDLSNEIEEFIHRAGVPSALSGAVDAVRNVGNFASHPVKNTSTGEIVDVEPGEAEWLLDVLEALFDFAFVQPRRLEARKSALNKKLADSGKPPMKA